MSSHKKQKHYSITSHLSKLDQSITMPPRNKTKQQQTPAATDALQPPSPGSPKNCDKRGPDLPVPESPKKKYKARGASFYKPKGGNTIVTFRSKVTEVLIHVFSKNSGANEGSYTHDMIVDWEENMLERCDEWGIHDWFDRKQVGSDDSFMHVKSDSDYPWKAGVSYTFYLKDGETPQSTGNNIARKFTDFAKDHPKVRVKNT